MAGRPRKSIEAKKTAGTLRPHRERERIQPEVFATLSTLPEPPEGLKDAGKKLWQELGKKLIGKGICNIDLFSFEMLCAQKDNESELYRELTLDGKRTLSAGIIEQPAVYRGYKFSIETQRKLLTEFGLTPKSRNNIDAPPPLEKNTEQYFKNETMKALISGDDLRLKELKKEQEKSERMKKRLGL